MTATTLFLVLSLAPMVASMLAAIAAIVLAHRMVRALEAPVEASLDANDTWAIDLEWELIEPLAAPHGAPRREGRPARPVRFPALRLPTVWVGIIGRAWNASQAACQELETTCRMGALAPSGGWPPRGVDPPGAGPPSRLPPRRSTRSKGS